MLGGGELVISSSRKNPFRGGGFMLGEKRERGGFMMKKVEKVWDFERDFGEILSRGGPDGIQNMEAFRLFFIAQERTSKKGMIFFERIEK